MDCFSYSRPMSTIPPITFAITTSSYWQPDVRQAREGRPRISKPDPNVAPMCRRARFCRLGAGGDLQKPRRPTLNPEDNSTENEDCGCNSSCRSEICGPRRAASREQHGGGKRGEQHAAEELGGVALKRGIDPRHRDAEKRRARNAPRHRRDGRAIVSTFDDC